MKDNKNILGVLAIVVSTFAARSDLVFGRELLQYFHVLFVIFLGSLVSFLFCFFYMEVSMKMKEFFAFFKENFVYLWINAFLAGILAPMLFLWAISEGSPLNASFFVSFTPVFVIILDYYFFKEKINRPFLIGSLLMFAGMSIVVTKGLTNLISLQWIDFFPLMSSFIYAVTNILSKKYIPLEHIDYLVTARLFITALATGLILLLIIPIEEFELTHLLPFWKSILGYSLITILFSYFLFYYGLKKLSSNLTSTLGLLSPLAGVFFSYFFLNEKIFRFHFVGGIFILIGMVIVNAHFKGRGVLVDMKMRQKSHHS